MLHIVSNSLQRVAFTFPLLFAVHTGTINLFLHWQITHTSCSLTLFFSSQRFAVIHQCEGLRG